MIQRAAILFDNRERPETTGFYVRRALGELVTRGQLVEIEHFLPYELDQIPQDKFDLFLWIDDGHEHEIPAHLKPNAWWVIDTHLKLDWSLQQASKFDHVFAAQLPGARAIQDSEHKSAHWLPLACDPLIHGEASNPKQFDFAFVGHLFPGPRQDLLNLLAGKYPRHFTGQCYFQEMAATYAAARIIFNRSLANDINMRVFEGLASGSLLITNRLADVGLGELLIEDEHYVAYDSEQELLEKVDFFLNNEDKREQLATAGKAHVLAHHTYRHRVEQLLSLCDSATSAPPPLRAAVAHKDTTYFEHVRQDVLELVPTTVRRVLDIGCGSGRLGAALKQRQQAYVTGIELNPQVARQAESCLDDVHCLDVETAQLSFEEQQFDCIICADVLEHLREPATLLRRIRTWLAPAGRLITSLPNVRHHSVIGSLLAGNWNYEPAGLLDQDHVRFFTKREIEKLLDRTGFAISHFAMVPSRDYPNWPAEETNWQLNLGPLNIHCGSREDADEFYAYQWLTVSTPQPETTFGLTSIIIVTCNQLWCTQLCLESIRFRTDEPYELIVVDNGSTDGTIDYLQAQPDVQLIANPENRGFPAAVNQGIAVAKGDNILLLNNDVVVTTGWLKHQLQVLHAHEQIGVVGPVTNRISGPQQINADYRDLSELDGFAWEWARRQLIDHAELDRLVGFSLLIKKQVLDEIGTLDERFGIGNFEDDDFCRRAQAAGYQTVVTPKAFIHHFGSQSFQGNGHDLGQILRQNQKLFDEKWNDTSSASEAHTARLPHPSFWFEETSQGLKLIRNTVKVSGCLIVRDNERTIRPCLESLRPWVDEIVVVDTGSQDDTPEICEELGARVFHWRWRDSFAAARNESFRHALGEWIFWMDSDDTLPEDCGRQLRELVAGEHPDNRLGYVMQVHCPGANPHDVTIVDHVKLIRNRPDLFFEFRIHEQIIPSIRRAGGDVAWTDIHVIHSGSEHTPESRQRKLKRDFRLLHTELLEHPDHPFVLFNLGMTHADAQQYHDAIRFLERCVEVSTPEESHLRKAFALLVSSLYQVGQQQPEFMQHATQVCLRGLQLFSDDKELLFRLAMLQQHQGQLTQAVQTYQRVLDEQTARHFASIDPGITGTKARHNLALVYEELEDWPNAEQQWREILRQQPNYVPAYLSLNDLLLRTGRIDEAREFIKSLGDREELSPTRTIMQSHLHNANKHYEKARACLEDGLNANPDEESLLNELAALLFEHFDLREAEPYLQQLVTLTPDDPAIWHNLGIIHQQQEDDQTAIQSFNRSLTLRPHYQPTLNSRAMSLRRESGKEITT